MRIQIKKSYVFTIAFLVTITLVFSVYQYFQALETGSVSAVTVGTPDPGHAWSQMECSADSLCVDTVNNRLGVGTNTPGEKLTVSGNLSITGSMTGGTVPWARLGSFPSACSSGQYVTAVGGTLTCSTPPTNTGPQGPQGPQGATGPAGPSGASASLSCVEISCSALSSCSADCPVGYVAVSCSNVSGSWGCGTGFAYISGNGCRATAQAGSCWASMLGNCCKLI